MAKLRRILLMILLPMCNSFLCRLTREALGRRLPKGWRGALRSLNAWLECEDSAEDAPPIPVEEYLRDLDYPALFFLVDLVKQDASEKLGFDVARQSDYVEIDKVHAIGPVGRWNVQMPRKALHRGDRVISVNRIAGNATKMVNEMRKSVRIHLKVLRVSQEDSRAIAKRRAAKELRKVLAIPPPSQQSLGLPEPAGSKVAILHARNIDQFLAQQPVTVLLIYKAGRCDHCQALSPEFTRAAELVEQMMLQQNVKFAKYNHDDKANLEHDIGDSERINVTSYPALFLVTSGRHEQFSLHTAEELAAFVGARAKGLDAEEEVKRVLLKTRPMLYRDDTPADVVRDLDPETFDEEVLTYSSENNRVWIIEYYSDRCPFCRSLKPEYIRAATQVRKELGHAVHFAAVNSRAFPDLAERFGVASYPWVISVYAGRKGDDMVGLGGAETVVRWAKAQHKKFWVSAPVWAEGLPQWPETAHSPPFELLQENNTGTWREVLGRRTWFLLHTLAARYPDEPSEADAAAARGLIASLGQHYPCPICKQHLQETLLHPALGPVDTSNRVAFARWMCQLHNAVNKKLGRADETCHSFELDLKYLKSCGECSGKIHIDEGSTERESHEGSAGWNYFNYLGTAAAPTGRTEL